MSHVPVSMRKSHLRESSNILDFEALEPAHKAVPRSSVHSPTRKSILRKSVKRVSETKTVNFDS